jgi:hypothetical protein
MFILAIFVVHLYDVVDNCCHFSNQKKSDMHLHYVTIFPELFDSFMSTSLIKRAQKNGLISCHTLSPRQFTHDKHQQVDDTLY